MNIPNSNSYDQWVSIDNSPKLTRSDMGNEDWIIETKLSLASYAADSKFHEGLFVKFGVNNYYIWGNLIGTGLELSRSGYPTLVEIQNFNNTDVYLRMRKVGNTYYCDYKNNSDDSWITAGSDTLSSSVQSVGLISKTWESISLITDFDYFRLNKD